MSKFIEGLINDLVVNDMITIKKMKKSELIEIAELLLRDNYRELHDETIVELYELQFETHLARY
jgi:hypothetical protein